MEKTLDQKRADTLAMYVKCASYRNNPLEMVKFIREHKEYFPSFNEELLASTEKENSKKKN